jgi:hypothetical protein
MIIRPPATEADFQLQKRLCRWVLRASVVRRVHLGRYSVLGLKILSSAVGRKVDAKRCSTVFFQDHA